MVKDCSKCNGRCCRYVVIEFDKPTELNDFDSIRWFVSHENVNVFIDDDGEWYLEFLTPCKYLDKNNRCTNYENRPQICRNYDVDECTFHNDYSQQYTFSNLEDVENYIQNVWNKSHSRLSKK